MKKPAAFLLALCLLLPLCLPAAYADDEILTGRWGGQEPIHNGLSTPFYPDSKVTNCRSLSMTLSISEYSGAPFGNWYLYAKDLSGVWDHIADFKLDRSLADGHSETYSFSFRSPVSFKALALCMRDKGNSYSLTWEEISFRVDPGSVGSKSSSLPARPAPTPKKDGLTLLAGSWGEQEPIKNGVYSPFHLSSKMTGCTALTMDLSIEDYSGYPFGDWYLYAKDLDNNWNHIAEFRIEREQGRGDVTRYDFHFTRPQSFKALAICVRDKGAEFSINWNIDFYA